MVAIIMIGALASSNGNTPSVSTNPTTPPTTANGATGQATGAPAPPVVAHIGSMISLTIDSPGEKMAVTLVKVISRAQRSDQFGTPDPGKRSYVVQLRLTGSGSVAYPGWSPNGSLA